MNENASVRKNTLLGLLAIVFWSFGAILAVELTSIPPFELLFCQFLIGFFVVLIRYSIAKEKKLFLNFKKKDMLITSSVLVINQFFYYSAFRHSPAVQVDLINYIWPTLLILFSSFLPNEKLCPSYVIACIMCLLGVYTLLSPDGGLILSSDYFLGYFLALGAAISWALYSLYSRYQGSSNSSNSSNCISWACGPAALACLFIHLSFEEFVCPTVFEAVFILVSGIFLIGLAFYFWDNGLKKGCVRFLGLSSYSIPVSSVLLLVLFGRADFEPRMITATLIISLAPLFPLMANKLRSLKVLLKHPQKKTPQLATLTSSKTL